MNANDLLIARISKISNNCKELSTYTCDIDTIDRVMYLDDYVHRVEAEITNDTYEYEIDEALDWVEEELEDLYYEVFSYS